VRISANFGPRGATALVLVAAAVLSGFLWLLRWETAPQRAYPDTFQYARISASIAGMSTPDAQAFAGRVVCRYGLTRGATYTACLKTWAPYTRPPRFLRIFTSRPGFPLVAAPFVAVGGERGFVAAVALFGVAAGVLIAVAVRLLGGSAVQSLFATAMLFLLPTGHWASRLLAEAPALAGTLAVLCGAMLLLRGRRAGGVGTEERRERGDQSDEASRRPLGPVAAGIIVAGGLAFTALVKPASGVLLALALAVVAGAAAAYGRMRRDPDRSALLLAGICLAVVVVWQLVVALAGLPGTNETVQDVLTDHFVRPDVADPWPRFLRLDRQVLAHELNVWINDGVPKAASAFLAAALAGAALLARAAPARIALMWLAAGATGIGLVLAHPIAGEADRLVSVIWLPVALGFALALRPARDSPRYPVNQAS